jgi:hypothetical protein
MLRLKLQNIKLQTPVVKLQNIKLQPPVVKLQHCATRQTATMRYM